MSDQTADPQDISFGTKVFTEDGERLGSVRGMDEHGLYISLDEGIASLSIEHLRSGHEFAEAELMWRCYQCGEFGDIEAGLPDECPSCGAAKEELYYYRDD